MLILVPWKPVVVVWCLVAAMLWVGYISYSVFEGKNPFAMAQHPLNHLAKHRAASDSATPYRIYPNSQ